MLLTQISMCCCTWNASHNELVLCQICFLSIQYQAVAEMQSTEFPTPLRDAECVSLLMAYELYRASQSEDKTTFLEWIACQLRSNNSERTAACLFAVSSIIYYTYVLK